MAKYKIPEEGIYDARPLGKGRMFLLGFQHMFAMFGATVLVPILTGLDVSTTLLFAGLGTLLFHLITGGKVPALLGSSFAFLGCYAAIALLGTLLGPDKEASMLFVFLGYYPLVKPKLDAIHSRALRLSTKLLLAVLAVGVDYLFLLFVLRLDAVTQELAGTAPAILWATCALGLALFLLYDLTLSRLTVLYRRRRR